MVPLQQNLQPLQKQMSLDFHVVLTAQILKWTKAHFLIISKCFISSMNYNTGNTCCYEEWMIVGAITVEILLGTQFVWLNWVWLNAIEYKISGTTTLVLQMFVTHISDYNVFQYDWNCNNHEYHKKIYITRTDLIFWKLGFIISITSPK